MEYDNTNRGALFKNEKRETEKHPEYNGTINVDGQEYWLSAWVNESKKGTKYFSLSVTAKQEAFDQAKQAVQGGGAPDLEDEIPFARHNDFIGG